MSGNRGLGEFSWQPHVLPGEALCSARRPLGTNVTAAMAAARVSDSCACRLEGVADSLAGRFFTSGYFLYIRPLPSFTGVNQPNFLDEALLNLWLE